MTSGRRFEGSDGLEWSPVERLAEVFEEPSYGEDGGDGDCTGVSTRRPGRPVSAGRAADGWRSWLPPASGPAADWRLRVPRWVTAVVLAALVAAAGATVVHLRAVTARATPTATYPGPEPSARAAVQAQLQPFVPSGGTGLALDSTLHSFTLTDRLTYVGGGPSTASATLRLVDAGGHPLAVGLAMLTTPQYQGQVIRDRTFVPPGVGGLVPGTQVLLVVRQPVVCRTSRGSVPEPSLQFTYGDEAGHQVFTVPWSELILAEQAYYSSIVHGVCGR